MPVTNCAAADDCRRRGREQNKYPFTVFPLENSINGAEEVVVIHIVRHGRVAMSQGVVEEEVVIHMVLHGLVAMGRGNMVVVVVAMLALSHRVAVAAAAAVAGDMVDVRPVVAVGGRLAQAVEAMAEVVNVEAVTAEVVKAAVVMAGVAMVAEGMVAVGMAGAVKA
uniref:Uncharacterized protein n=1 Tax=Oryza brachyantha TaxID=4533 RepID=J3KX00_ORYBR